MSSNIEVRPARAIPRVSVTMPVLNNARWIGAAIQSVLDQDFGEFELIVVDDGSSDDSLKIARQYAELDQRVHVYSLEHIGVAEARNFAIRQARGEYIAIMDSDDLAAPDRLTKQVALLDAHPEVLVVSSRTAVIHNQLTVPSSLDGLKVVTEDERPSSRLDGFNLSRVRAGHAPAMIRRSAILQAGLYRSFFRTAEDTDLFLRIEELGEFRSLPEVLQFRRRHTANTNLRLSYTLAESATIAQILAKRRRQGRPDRVNGPMPRFFRLFYLGFLPHEIGHALILIALRCMKRTWTRSRRLRMANRALEQSPLVLPKP